MAQRERRVGADGRRDQPFGTGLHAQDPSHRFDVLRRRPPSSPTAAARTGHERGGRVAARAARRPPRRPPTRRAPESRGSRCSPTARRGAAARSSTPRAARRPPATMRPDGSVAKPSSSGPGARRAGLEQVHHQRVGAGAHADAGAGAVDHRVDIEHRAVAQGDRQPVGALARVGHARGVHAQRSLGAALLQPGCDGGVDAVPHAVPAAGGGREERAAAPARPAGPRARW